MIKYFCITICVFFVCISASYAYHKHLVHKEKALERTLTFIESLELGVDVGVDVNVNVILSGKK